jgi:hypothetical protein
LLIRLDDEECRFGVAKTMWVNKVLGHLSKRSLCRSNGVG